MSQQHLSSNTIDMWFFGGASPVKGVDYPFLTQGLVTVGGIFGSGTKADDKRSFVMTLLKRLRSIHHVQLVCVDAPMHVWALQDHLRLSDHLPQYVGTVEIHTYSEDLGYDAYFTLTRNTLGIFISTSELRLPIDHVYLKTTKECLIFGIHNLETLTLTAPVDPMDFVQHLPLTCKTVVEFLKNFYSLRDIVIPLDWGHGTRELVSALEQHWDLAALEFTLPSTTDLSISPSFSGDISSSVAEQIWILSNLRTVCVPDEFMSADLLENLGYLRALELLKIKPGRRTGVRRFIQIVLESELPNFHSFLSLSRLDIDKKRVSESDFTALAGTFPNVTII